MNDRWIRLISRGHNAQRKGIYRSAARLFEQAIPLANNYKDSGDSHRLTAVACHMCKEYFMAIQHFEYALEYYDDLPNEATICLRDYGAVLAESGRHLEALEKFSMSNKRLLSSNFTDEEQEIQSSYTKSYIAHTHWLMNRTKQSKEQQREITAIFEATNTILDGKHDEWQLNNMIWWLKAEQPLKRIVIAKKAVQLARKTTTRPDATQAVIHALGANQLHGKYKPQR